MVCENRHKSICHCAKPEYTRKKCPHCLIVFNVCGLCKGKREERAPEIKHKHPQQVALHKQQPNTGYAQGNIRIIKSPIKTNPAQGVVNRPKVVRTPQAKTTPPMSGNKIMTSPKNVDGQGPIITREGVFQVSKGNKPIHINSTDWSNLDKNLQTNPGVFTSKNVVPQHPVNNPVANQVSNQQYIQTAKPVQPIKPVPNPSNKVNGPQAGLFTINRMKDPENKITARSNEDYFQDIKEVNTKGRKKDSTSYRQHFSKNKGSEDTDDLWPKELAGLSKKPGGYDEKYPRNHHMKSHKDRSKKSKHKSRKDRKKKSRSSSSTQKKPRRDREVYRKLNRSKA